MGKEKTTMDSPLGEYIYFYCHIPCSGPCHLIIYDENIFILIVLFLPPGLRSSLLKESVFSKELSQKGTHSWSHQQRGKKGMACVEGCYQELPEACTWFPQFHSLMY